jgi:RNA recognition motif. (a.k.a. RRM, RBD, or RNP domain)
MFGAENGMNSLRFGANNRDAFGAPLQGPGASNMNFPFDMQAAQTWNGGAPVPSFATNGMGAMTQNGDYGHNRGIKPSRGRAGINNVSSHLFDRCVRLTRE